MAGPDALDGLARGTFTSTDGVSHEVFRAGSGPAVVIIHEVPGLTPRVADFARAVSDRGMTVVLPSLVGTPGRPPSNAYGLASMARVCVSREFTLLATDRSSLVTRYLRELAAYEHATCGGPGVGVVGMCLTGNFALAMSADPVVLAPVLSQPALPLPLGMRRRRATGVAPEDIDEVRRRTDQGYCVLGLRFSEDSKVPAERFAFLRETLGDGFVGMEIDSSTGNPWGYARAAHSVLTEDYVDIEGSPTRRALDQVLDFLSVRLGGTG